MLAIELAGDDEEVNPQLLSALRMLDADTATSPWLRNDYELAPPPEDLAAAARDQFEQALGWAGEGLWAQAAAVFQALAMDGLAEADRNLGLCRLWMADLDGAYEALRRYLAHTDASVDAVDIEALCQLISPPIPGDRVNNVHLIWTLRDRDLLSNALRASDRIQPRGPGRLQSGAPDQSFEVDVFEVLDRPKPTGELPRDVREMPQIVGRILVARELAILEAHDDGRLERLTNWFVDLAGPAIPPAHPKTREIGKGSRAELAMQPSWWLPDDAPAKLAQDLNRQARVRTVVDAWPETPMPYLNGRTPLEAARDGHAEVALRAAVCQFEFNLEFWREAIDFAALRSRLNIPDEPEIDPETVSIDYLHLARLHRVPAYQLDDDRLIVLFLRAHGGVLPLAMERAAEAIVTRPTVLDREEINPVMVYTDLANLAMSRQDEAGAVSWLARGRQADPAGRTTNALRWDFAELRLQARSEPPEAWVPNLAVILDRYQNDESANQVLLSNLIDMGLIQVAPHPDKPDDVLLDTRPLQAVLAKYGPRITTAAGTLGVSATKGTIWTPGATPAGTTTSGGIWTPGSQTSGDAGKKLIIPG